MPGPQSARSARLGKRNRPWGFAGTCGLTQELTHHTRSD